MQIFKESPLFQAINIIITNNQRKEGTSLFAGRVGSYQLKCEHEDSREECLSRAQSLAAVVGPSSTSKKRSPFISFIVCFCKFLLWL